MYSSKIRTLMGGLSAIVTAAMLVGSMAMSFAAGSIVPPLSSHSFYGWNGTKAADASSAGAPAKPVITLTSTTKAANFWSAGAGEGLTAPVTAGEKLTATFYIKAVSPASITTDFSFEKGKAPYTSSAHQPISAGKSWKKVTVSFACKEAYTAADAHILFHTGYAQESFQVAGLTLTPGK